MTIADVNFNPKNKNQRLHAEAYAVMLFIEEIHKTIKQGIAPNRIVKIYENAQNRCARRFKLAYK